MKKIVLSGGPCSGKTFTANWLRKSGDIAVVPEGATQLLDMGCKPGNTLFQQYIFKRQLDNERIISAFSNDLDCKYIVFDRAIIDGVAYYELTGNPVEEYLEFIGSHLGKVVTISDLLNRYDSVIYFPSLAVTNPDAYMVLKDKRFESVEQAQHVDAIIKKYWSLHPNFQELPVYYNPTHLIVDDMIRKS